MMYVNHYDKLAVKPSAMFPKLEKIYSARTMHAIPHYEFNRPLSTPVAYFTNMV